MVTHNNWSKPIAYFLYFGFGKKAAGTFCWIMTALISPLSVSRSLFPPLLSLSFSPSRMVLVFICSVLCPWGMLAAQTFCAVCFLVCVCVCLRKRETFSPRVCVKGIYFPYLCDEERARGMRAGKRDTERGELCEVSDISPTNPAGCETSQLSDLTSLRGIHSFFLSLLSSSSSCFLPSLSLIFFSP